jgi:hypothetical protein
MAQFTSLREISAPRVIDNQFLPVPLGPD